jgi:hypothetical protein
LRFKLSKTKVDLHALALEKGQAVWNFPAVKGEGKNHLELSDAMLEAFSAVMVCVGRDTANPETMGVTFMQEDDQLSFFGTDTDCIAGASTASPKGFKLGKPKIIPAVFIEQVIRSCTNGGFIEFHDDCVVAGNEDDLLIYARLLFTDRPLNMHEHLAKAAEYSKKQKFKIPERLEQVLAQMDVLFSGTIDEPMTIQIKEGKMLMSGALHGKGSLKDYVEVPDNVPALSLRIVPRFIRRVLPLAKSMVCTEDHVRLSGKNGFSYIASVSRENNDAP